MLFQGLFTPSRTRVAGEALYASAARQARQPAFYASLGVADSAEKRFELLTLHVTLIVLRLRGQGEAAGETSQHLFDTFVQALDDALREMGVGDLSVGKKMRKLGEAFYGRARAYEEALAALPDDSALKDLIARTALDETDPSKAATLADYVSRTRESLDGQSLSDLLDGRVAWPHVTP